VARYLDVIDLPLAPHAAFDLLADFSLTSQWDPSVRRARRLTHGPLGPGSRFEVVTGFWGRRVRLEYVIRAYEPPRRLVLEAHTPTFESRDEIRFAPRGSGTRVRYAAEIELFGLARLADPLLAVAFAPLGHAAATGLRAFAEERASAPRSERRSA